MMAGRSSIRSRGTSTTTKVHLSRRSKTRGSRRQYGRGPTDRSHPKAPPGLSAWVKCRFKSSRRSQRAAFASHTAFCHGTLHCGYSTISLRARNGAIGEVRSRATRPQPRAQSVNYVMVRPPQAYRCALSFSPHACEGSRRTHGCSFPRAQWLCKANATRKPFASQS